MQIIIIKSLKLYKYPFPSNNVNSYWIKDIDENDNERELICLEKKDDKWILESNSVCQVFDMSEKIDHLTIEYNKLYILKIVSQNKMTQAFICFQNNSEFEYKTFSITKDGSYTIGTSADQSIILNSQLIKENHAILKKENGRFFIESVDNQLGIFVNEEKESSYSLANGDIVFILGYKIIALNNNIIIYNFNNGLQINSVDIVEEKLPQYSGDLLPTTEDENALLYNENDYYSRSPRFVTSIVPENFSIDSPPGKTKDDETPAIFTIGPMITMAMSSSISAATSLFNLTNGKGTLASTLPTLVISATMLTSTLLWPSLTKKYQKKLNAKNEVKRQKAYINYLIEKRKKIENIKINQFQILTENYADPLACTNIILNKKRNLWERLIENEDFLSVRIGTGNIPLAINLSYSAEDFTMSEDNLKDELNKVVESAKEIKSAPVTINLTERNKLVVIGETRYKEAILKNIILELVTYHSYDDLKLAFMISDTTSEIWESFKILPHAWSNSRDIRFFANEYDDMSKISFYLEQVFTSRKYIDDGSGRKESGLTYKNVKPYYLIVVDNIKKNKNIEIIKKILEEKTNIGFGLIILNDGINNLPNECTDFLMADGEKSAIIKNDLNKDNQQGFVMDQSNYDISLICEKLSNIPIKMPLQLDEIKSSVGFLELYKVGNVEQLNILDRWNNNNPVNSLSAPVGIHPDQELFTLDLHEKFHGPHGLIAGMTGSGKSEFIITYILSMCVNYDPREVSFVLIDYKGGGLTGAFENKLTGVKLPHLAGTITNLDTAEIKRSLASIQSELKRRQALFNKAKLNLNESTLDIYKYQKLFRDGLISEPISHLFIISDEFAELKTQQPDFMDQLISTARIGRSLGVHLILATQKPSGIVDDQIWSNSRFRVCLKVQEKSDSMDVIKCPDAAELKKAGRFYLQVGYNDYFAMGQAAWAGTKYIPKDKITKIVDTNVSFINNIGDTIKSVDTIKRQNLVSKGEELPNVLKYIYDSAKIKNIQAEKLWLDKIPAEIFVGDLMLKYQYQSSKWNIEAIIGEYDDPNNQRQGLLTLDFNNSGNTLIYGIGGSGTEILISTIIYSLIIAHSSDEINIYVIDFGSEMFGVFKPAPQVGDVVYINDLEKLTNLFNIINSVLELRKKEFVNYNGDYNLYIKSSKRTTPRYIIIINNYEAFNETYEDYVDVIASLSREGERYGISFIISASGANAVRSKISQNFSQQFCLQFNDPSDYSSVLGSTHGLVPSEITGRGLVKIDGGLYEFQTAYPYKWDQISQFIKIICEKLNAKLTNAARTIAVLPEHVRMNDISSGINNLRSVPIGIVKDSLKIATFDFTKSPISLISAQDISAYEKFVPSLAEVLLKVNNNNVYVFDCNEAIQNKNTFNNYYSNNYKEAYEKFKEIYDTAVEDEKLYTFMLYGFDAFKNNLPNETVKSFYTMLTGIKNKKNIRVILIDNVTKIKAVEFEEFFKNNIQTTNAIWVGSGITDQFTIKCSTYNKETRAAIENDFGYNLLKGKATFIKLLDFYSRD